MYVCMIVIGIGIFFVIVIGLFVCLTLNAPCRRHARPERPRPPGEDSPRPQTVLNTPPYVVIVWSIPCNAQRKRQVCVYQTWHVGKCREYW